MAPARAHLPGSLPRLALLAALFASAACMPLGTGATQSFTTRLACPPERVATVPRPDVHPHDFVPHPPPAPEVLADPERLAYFVDVERERDEKFDRGAAVFEVAGCGVCERLLCKHPLIGSAKIDVSHVDCERIGDCVWQPEEE